MEVLTIIYNNVRSTMNNKVRVFGTFLTKKFVYYDGMA